MEPLRGGDPTQVGRYQTKGRLGTGGMGVVFLAEGPRGTVALKLVRPDLGDDASFRARFRREVQASFRVSSAYTAKLIDFDTETDRPWMATEFVEGPSLEQLVAQRGPLGADEQLSLARGLAQALVAIHDEDVIHRDLKPGNVLMTPAGPKVIDFGIAAAADAARITTHGLMVGSPGWLAPEQIETGAASPASDIFAFGLVLCFAASGEPPFGTGTTEALLFRAMNSAPNVPLDQLARPLHRPVLAAISRDPGHRPAAPDLVAYLSEPAAPSPTVVSKAPEPAAAAQAAPAQPLSSPPQPPATDPPHPPPPPGYPPPVPPPAEPPPPWSPSPPGPIPARSRPGWVLPVAVAAVLAVIGGVVGLIIGLGGSSTKAGPTPSPSVSTSTSPLPTPTPTLGAAERATLASAALVRPGDFPGTTRSTERTAISLPCNVADAKVPDGTTLRGLFTKSSGTNNGDYVSETVAVFPTVAEAQDAFSTIQGRLDGCHGYTSTYQNETDVVTIAEGPLSFGAGDESVYVGERFTPSNYKGSATGTGTALVRRGAVIVRLLSEYHYQADGVRARSLARVLVGRVAAAG